MSEEAEKRNYKNTDPIKWRNFDRQAKYKYWTGEIKTGAEWYDLDWSNGMIDPLNLTKIEDSPKKDLSEYEIGQIYGNALRSKSKKETILCFDYINLNKEKQELLAELMREPPLSELIFDLIINRIREIHKILRDDHEGRK